jgi:hypothetical protein
MLIACTNDRQHRAFFIVRQFASAVLKRRLSMQLADPARQCMDDAKSMHSL